MGFESLSIASRNRLIEIASQAYGSGKNEGINGGAGRIGILTDSDGNTHVVKFNTKLSERLFGPAKTDYMIDSCNRLRTELIALAKEAGLGDEEMANIRAKLGLSPGSDKSTTLLDRTVVAQIATIIGKSNNHKKNVWDFAQPKATKSLKDMSFETVASRQVFATKEATAEKVNELEKFGLTYNSFKAAVETLYANKKLPPNGKPILFSQMADHVFTTMCGKPGDRAAREAEVRECLESIADGTHPVIRRHIDEAAMINYLQGRVEATMQEKPVTASALFALYKEASTLIARHCDILGIKLGNPQLMEDDPCNRTIAALLKNSKKLMNATGDVKNSAHSEVHGWICQKEDPVLMGINSFYSRLNFMRLKIDDENTAGSIGLKLDQFKDVFNAAQVPPKYKDLIWDRCKVRISDNSAAIKSDIERNGTDVLKTFIKKTAKMVIAEENEKNGPSLNWGKEIDSFGGVFAKDAESRNIGIALMKKFHKWFVAYAGSPKEQLPKGGYSLSMENGLRYFMFRELALRDSVTDDPKAMFGENALMALLDKGLIRHGAAPMVLMVMPPEKRQVLYAAVKALPGPVGDQCNDARLFCRIVHHLDEVQKLTADGRLNAKSLFATIFPDYEGEIPEPLTTEDFEKAYHSFDDKLEEKYGGLTDQKYLKALNLQDSGKTFDEIQEAMDGKPVKPEKYPVEMGMSLSEFSEGVNPGETLLAANICRPTMADWMGEGAYTFNFPNGETVVSVRQEGATPETRERIAGKVADEVVKLCGEKNFAQISIVEAHMCQAGFAGEIGSRMKAMGYKTDEHMALTFTLTRNDETGTVNIHYSEPKGSKLGISADITVHTDGHVEKSELNVEKLKG